MICIYKDKNNKTSLVEKDLREIKQGEILVSVKYSGICKTDVYMFKNSIDNNNVILGHEGSGIVKSSKSNLFNQGDHVTWNPYFKDNNFLGINYNGCFSEEVIISEEYLFKHSFSHDLAAYTEPCSAALSPISHIDDKNKSILIMGDNRISLLTYILFNNLNYNVFIEDKLDSYDYIIETNSKNSNLNFAIEKIKQNGTIFVKNRSFENQTINISKIVYKEITLKGSLFLDFNQTFKLMEPSKKDITNLIGEKYSIHDWRSAFSKGFDGNKKIMFKF